MCWFIELFLLELSQLPHSLAQSHCNRICQVKTAHLARKRNSDQLMLESLLNFRSELFLLELSQLPHSLAQSHCNRICQVKTAHLARKRNSDQLMLESLLNFSGKPHGFFTEHQ